jgi:hypothetical protein
MTRNQAILLRTFCIWTIWVWGTRVWNIVRDDEHEVGFKVVHSVLALVSVVLAVIGLVVVRRVRRATITDRA